MFKRAETWFQASPLYKTVFLILLYLIDMTNKEFKSSVLALLRNSEFEKKIDKAMLCGAIDVESQDPNDYTTRKALAHVILKSCSDDWEPLTKQGKDEVKNLEKFI